MSVERAATLARAASRILSVTHRKVKDEALLAMADALDKHATEILTANGRDVDQARATKTADHLIDRLTLDQARVAAMAEAIRSIADLADPIGEVVRGSVLANGLELKQIRVPLGVVGIIYESRPNVTADAAALCVKSGNAVLLRGSSSAAKSNQAIVAALREAVESVGLPADAIQLIDAGNRETARELMRARGLVDVVIPRGGAGLIQTVVEQSTVPVIETGVGNCHVYVDAAADLDMALNIVLNSKTHRPSVCNAAESLLVHEEVAEEFLPRVVEALVDAGVTIHGDDRFQSLNPGVLAVTDEDYATEFLAMELSARVVPAIDDAIHHIQCFGSGHTEAIVSNDARAIQKFTAEVDAAAVMVNASTRFTDGGEFGFGAEMGISTQKLHARGPMALPEMTTTKYVVTGSGQIR